MRRRVLVRMPPGPMALRVVTMDHPAAEAALARRGDPRVGGRGERSVGMLWHAPLRADPAGEAESDASADAFLWVMRGQAEARVAAGVMEMGIGSPPCDAWLDASQPPLSWVAEAASAAASSRGKAIRLPRPAWVVPARDDAPDGIVAVALYPQAAVVVLVRSPHLRRGGCGGCGGCLGSRGSSGR